MISWRLSKYLNRYQDSYYGTLCGVTYTHGPNHSLTHIQKGLLEAGIPVLETELHEREAFRTVFSFQQILAGLNPADVSNIDKAQANVEEFAAEILQLLTSPRGHSSQ